MSSVIPKEQLTAYQRWELASFGDDGKSEATAAETAAARLTEQLQKANEEARLAAYAAGLEEGRSAGFEQGRAAGMAEGRAEGLAQGRAQAEEERIQFQRIAAEFAAEISGASERVATDILELALDLSKAMLHNALSVRPEVVVPIVGDAIRYLPSLQQPALLHLHPADALLVRNLMGDELDNAGWRMVEDAHMERGGCRIETATNQIDASTSTRWRRLVTALGKESDWLEP